LIGGVNYFRFGNGKRELRDILGIYKFVPEIESIRG
jgi:hypothetical protein